MRSSRVESVIRILYEDNHLIGVFKPARVPIQEDDSKDASLMDLTKAYLKQKYQKPGNVYLGLVHRLDRPVSGVVVFAKTSKAASRLSEAFRGRKIRKSYHALVEGRLVGEGRLSHFMAKDEIENTVTIRNAPFEGAKEAILEYGAIKEKDGKTLLEVELKTGRKHQIRAQFSQIGHPIVGDKKYGSGVPFRDREIALTAMRLEFPHPVKDETVTLQMDDDGFDFK